MTRIRQVSWVMMAAGLAFCGCAERNVALEAEPSFAELAELNEALPRMAALVAVDTYDPPPTIFDIEKFENVGPTPEEQAILGEPVKTPEPDALAFYKPARGPEHGVSPFARPVTVGEWGYGGVVTARDRVAPRVGVWGMGANYVGETLFSRGRAGYVGMPRGSSAVASGLTPATRVGEGFPRTGAERRPRIEY